MRIDVTLDSTDAPAYVANYLSLAPGAAFESCRVNPEIQKEDTAFGFYGVTCTPGVDCVRVRAVVLSLRDHSRVPIPDGARLYSCDVTLARDLVPGTELPVVCSGLEANTADYEVLPSTCVDGAIQVVAITQTPTLPPPTSTPAPTCTPAPVGVADLVVTHLDPVDDYVGPGLALDGQRLACGTRGDAEAFAGRAAIFERRDAAWQEAMRFPLASDDVGAAYLGNAVALSGDTLAVGAVGDPSGGAVYVYRRVGEEWALEEKVVGSAADSAFGAALALSGDVLVVGDPVVDPFRASERGRAYFFRRRNGQWHEELLLEAHAGRQGFASAVGVSGDTAVIGGADDARIWRFDGDSWILEVASLTPLGGRNGDDGFGEFLAISGPTVVVGAPSESVDFRPGRLHVFERRNGQWPAVAVFTADMPHTRDGFANHVATSGGTILVSQLLGPVSVLRRRGTLWQKEELLPAPVDWNGYGYGVGLAVSDGTMAVGVRGAQLTRGEVILFERCTPRLVAALGTQAARAGVPSVLEITLEPRGVRVSRARFDITSDPAVWSPAASDGATLPCRVADDLAGRFSLTETFLAVEQRVRITLESTASPPADLPRDGWVGSCPIAAADGAELRTHSLRCGAAETHEASDRNGARISLECTDGEIDISACAGDCNRNGRVTVDELVSGVALALSNAAPASCAAMDVDDDGRVMIADLVSAVAVALDGCTA